MEPQPPGGPRRARRLVPLAAALLVAALLAVTTGDTARAQDPPEDPVLVNAGEKFIERKDDGSFIARPVFDRQIADLYYGIRHPDTGEWIGAVYKLTGERRGSARAGSTRSSTPSSTGSPSSTPAAGLRWLIQTPQGKANGSTIYWKTNVSLVRNRSTPRGDDDA